MRLKSCSSLHVYIYIYTYICLQKQVQVDVHCLGLCAQNVWDAHICIISMCQWPRFHGMFPWYRQFQKAICKQPKLEVQVLLGSSSPPSPPRQHGFQDKAGRPDSHWAHRDLQGPFQLEMVLEALHRPIWGLNFQEGIILGRAPRAAWQDHGEIPDLEQSTVLAFPAYLGVKMNFIFFLVFLFWAWVVFPCSCSCLLSSWSSQLGLF